MVEILEKQTTGLHTIGTFTIDEGILGRVIKWVDKINKAAGADEHSTIRPITMRVVERGGSTNKDLVRVPGAMRARGNWATIELVGEDPLVGEWRYLKELRFTREGKLVRSLEGGMLGQVQDGIEPACEHCNYKRVRVMTVLLEKITTGEIRQVGSSCITDYTGGANPHRVVKWYEQVTNLVYMLSKHVKGGSTLNAEILDLTQFLATVAWLIRTEGWTSRKHARENFRPETATADKALAHMDMVALQEWDRRKKSLPQPEEQDFVVASRTLDWVRTTLNQLDDDESQFEQEVVVACGSEFVPRKLAGLASSAVAIYVKPSNWMRIKLEKQWRKTRQAISRSRVIGREDSPWTFDLMVDGYIPNNDPNYPGAGKYLMHDRDGNRVIWNSAKGVHPKLTLGAKVRIHAWVSKQRQVTEIATDYETTIRQCRVEDLPWANDEKVVWL